MDFDLIKQSLASPPVPRHSDLGQDILALVVNQWCRDGYFVEVGALDGIRGSNTYLLETQYDWNGILAEPAQCWHPVLGTNRRCNIDHRAVAGATGMSVRFKETDTQLGLSGIVDYWDQKECHTGRRMKSAGREYRVDTVTLHDLLDTHQAPAYINYISLDTEGSELAILEHFDFRRCQVGLWTIEHNYLDSARNAIRDIMEQHGYQRILTDLSTIDDWYIPRP